MRPPADAPSMKRASLSRGLTLIELIVVVTLVALLMGAMIIGMGATTNARIRSATTLVASGIRVAFSRSQSTSKSMRLVFDLDRHSLLLEESDTPMLVRRDDVVTGGAEGSTPQETEAIEEATRIVEGPTAPRPAFRPVAALGFEADDPTSGRELGRNVAFKRVEVAHAEDPVTTGRAYLYFWPGGMTERASIQIGRKDAEGDDGVISILVSPLTGKVKVLSGAKPMESPRDDSDREDRGF